MGLHLSDSEVRVIKAGRTVIYQAIREFFINNAEELLGIELGVDDCLHLSISPEFNEVIFFAYRDPECDLLLTNKIIQFIDENISFTTDELYVNEEKSKMYNVFHKDKW